MAVNIACRCIVADGVLVQGGRGAAYDHSVATVNGDAANLGGALPDDLCKMTDIVEDIVGDVCLAEVRQHGRELALVPTLSNAGSNIERVARNGEKVLSLTGSVRDVMLEPASLGSKGGGLSTSVIPDQRSSVVVGTGTVVMKQN